MVIPFIYEETSDFYDGLCGVKLNGKWGCIDKKGKLIIQCIYEELNGPSKDGLLWVTEKNWWQSDTGIFKGHINKLGVEFWED